MTNPHGDPPEANDFIEDALKRGVDPFSPAGFQDEIKWIMSVGGIRKVVESDDDDHVFPLGYDGDLEEEIARIRSQKGPHEFASLHFDAYDCIAHYHANRGAAADEEFPESEDDISSSGVVSSPLEPAPRAELRRLFADGFFLRRYRDVTTPFC